MNYVLDLNMSRSDELKALLDKGHNIIVLDDFTVECFKSRDAYGTLFKHFSILRQYPQSVSFSKLRGELFNLEFKTGRPVQPNEIIDVDTTKKLREILTFSKEKLRESMSNTQHIANKLINENHLFAENFIRDVATKAGALNLKEYKSNANKLRQDIAEVSLIVTKQQLEGKCSKPFNLNAFEKEKSIIFSSTYSLLWKIIKWGIERGYENTKKIDNDGFDLRYVSLSVFFDGILTKEKWLNECRNSILLYYEQESP